MKKIIIASLLCLVVLLTQQPSPLSYPETREDNITDDYHGTLVADPYRWLEDDNSEETATWVKAQNEVTFNYLEQIPYRNKIKDRLTEVWDYPKYSVPFKKGENYYFYKNDGLQNQYVLYVQDDLESVAEVLIDPNTFSEDGTVALSGIYFPKDARYMGYSKSTSGSDWRDFYIMDLETRDDLEDHLKWIKFSGMSWAGDGFYYGRFPEPAEGEELSGTNENSKIYYHHIGTDQAEDKLIYEDLENPRIFPSVSTTEDERFLVLYRSKGTHGNTVSVRDLSNPESDFVNIVTDFDGEHSVVDNVDDKILMLTDRSAFKNRLVQVDLVNPSEENWNDILHEAEHTLASVSSVGGKLIARYMQDATSRVYVFSLDGTLEGEIELPALGTARGFSGDRDMTEVFYRFQSFAFPPTIFHYDMNTGESTIFRTSEVDFNPDLYETEQIFYTGKDGTLVPMFITYKKGMVRDGTNPTLLYAYGGFNISLTPSFSTSNIILLEKGGIYALANLRGGGEYGDQWHKGGMLLNKQNVFDDFISAAEYLIRERYTSPEKLAVRGGSNGGLLIGAVMNQRPGLFRVAFPAVGVMDMLRFHKFTIGWAWEVEYGDSDNPEHFKNLYSYSPLHNIKVGGAYPATMITTADHDDRVVPAHSFKYAATLQEKVRDNELPLLIRIETKAGHGAGKPTSKIIEELADMWSFMFYNMELSY